VSRDFEIGTVRRSLRTVSRQYSVLSPVRG